MLFKCQVHIVASLDADSPAVLALVCFPGWLGYFSKVYFPCSIISDILHQIQRVALNMTTVDDSGLRSVLFVTFPDLC